MNRGQIISLLGGFGLIIGALLPWVEAKTFLVSVSKAGYEGDGVITGGIGLLLLLGAILYKGNPGKIYSLAVTIFGVIAGLILIYDINNVISLESTGSATISIGAGLYLSLVGSIFAFIGGLTKNPEVIANQNEPQIIVDNNLPKQIDLSKPNLESRLMSLKDLLDKGLITQDEFEKKRNEIITGI